MTINDKKLRAITAASNQLHQLSELEMDATLRARVRALNDEVLRLMRPMLGLVSTSVAEETLS